MAMIVETRIEDLVRAPGHADEKELISLFAQASIAVQTSHTEGLSIALLEQMMAGLAVVATDVGDTRQAIIHERTGLLIPPKHDDALADTLKRLIADVGLRKALGRAARQHALANYSLQAMSRRAIEAYQDVLGDH